MFKKSNILISTIVLIFIVLIYSCIENKPQRGLNVDVQDGINIEFLFIGKSNKNKSYSSGENMISYNNIGILDAISDLTHIPLEYFSLDGNANNSLIDLKITSTIKLSKNDALNAFVKYLKKNQNILISFPNRLVETYVANVEGSISFNECNNKNVYDKITLINRTWKGECVTTDALISQINDWYNLFIINEININKDPHRYNITVQKANSPEELFFELKEYHNITIHRKERNIKTIKVDFR